jgi:hypothetical protein
MLARRAGGGLVTLLSAVAGRLAVAMSAPWAARLKAEILGPAETIALEQACRDAVEEVVRRKLASDVDNVQIAHILQLLNDALQARGVPDVPSVEILTGSGAAATWRQALDRLGYDAETLPLALDAFVRELQQVLPETLRAHGARDGSPLFHGVALADLDRLRRDAQQMHTAIVRRVVVPAVPLTRELEAALNDSYELCYATNTPFYTPHLLLALLNARDGAVHRCFDEVEPGFGNEIQTQLAAYVANPPGEGSFVAFRWLEREDIRRAQDLAAEVWSPVVTSPLLLVAVLDTSSRTQRQLLTRLGSEGLKRLRTRAVKAHRVSWPPSTPGTVFDA